MHVINLSSRNNACIRISLKTIKEIDMPLVFHKYQNNFEFVSIVKIFKSPSCVIFYHDRSSVFFAYTNNAIHLSTILHSTLPVLRTQGTLSFSFYRCWIAFHLVARSSLVSFQTSVSSTELAFKPVPYHQWIEGPPKSDNSFQWFYGGHKSVNKSALSYRTLPGIRFVLPYFT